MWPLPDLKNELVTIVIDSSHLYLGVIRANTIKNTPFVLHAYRAIQNVALDTYIYNMSFFEKQIKAFIASYKLENAFFVLSIAGPKIEERLVHLKKATPSHADFIHLGLQKFVWDFTYLYTHEQGESVFAISGIQRELLFQYQFLALKLNINLVTITTPMHSLLHLYRYVQGDAFRQAKLAIDMQAHRNHFESYFDQPMYNRIIQSNQSITSSVALRMTGLYCMEWINR